MDLAISKRKPKREAKHMVRDNRKGDEQKNADDKAAQILSQPTDPKQARPVLRIIWNAKAAPIPPVK